MKKLMLIGLSLGLLCSTSTGFAQSYAEGALLFSQTNPAGTARIQALGGAQTSLGGDLSLSLSNPAGLGMYNRSAVTITGAFLNNSTESSFYNTVTPDSKINLNIPQMGVVINKSSDRGNGFKGGSLAINFSRLNSYHKNISYSARPDNGIIDYFLDDVDGLPLSSFDEGGINYNSVTGLGWYTYLIDTIGGFYDSYVLSLPSNQSEEISLRGSQNQWNFSYGGNYDDKIFFGAGLGLSSFRYNSKKRFNEYYSSGELNSIDIEENLFISGAGINFTVGMIVRPIDFIQVGASYTTPTLYNINDEWDAEIVSDWNNFTYPSTGEVLNTISEQTEILISDYTLTAPSRASLGVTGFLGKVGFVTVDYETRDYSKTRLSSRDFSMSTDNSEILSDYVKTTALRFGTEFRYDIFRFRAGGGYESSPYKGDDPTGLDRSIKTITGGLGIKSKEFFVDFALVKASFDALTYPYFSSGVDNSVKSSISNVTGMVSVGFNF